MSKAHEVESAVADLRRRIQEHSAFDAPVARKLSRLVEPGLSFRLAPPEDDSPGCSRLGGRPDLPDPERWPTYRGWPMVFLAQLSLTQLHDYLPGVLPRRGMLFFFAHFAPEDDWLWIRESRQEFAVLHTASIGECPWHRGLPDIFRFAPRPMRFTPKASLPDVDSPKVARLKMSADQRDAYNELDAGVPNRVLGRPRACQWIVGASWSQAVSPKHQPHSKRVAASENFRHLLSFSVRDAFRELGGGRLYFGMRKADFRAQKWERTLLVGQGS